MCRGLSSREKLIGIAPKGLQRVFYSDSGATAVEIALKMAVQYWQLKGEKQRTRIASLADSYHGDTVGSMSLGYSETFHRFYKELLFPVLRLTPPHVFRYYQHMSEAAALDAAVNEAEETLTANKDTLAALIMEPLMQGAAGMWAQPAGYVQALHDICRRHGILFILDEVATGFGRTGKMFACEHAERSAGSALLGEGYHRRLSASGGDFEHGGNFFGLSRAEYKEFKTFFHGHTYTGNPLGCAVASANLALFERENTIETHATEDRVFAHAAA